MTKRNQTIKYSAFITESKALEIAKSLVDDAVINKDGLVTRGTGDTTLIALTVLGKFSEGLHEYIRNGHLNTIVLLRINEESLREMGSLFIEANYAPLLEELNRIGRVVLEFCPAHVKEKLGVAYKVYIDEHGAAVLDIYTTKPVVNEYKPHFVELLGV